MLYSKQPRLAKVDGNVRPDGGMAVVREMAVAWQCRGPVGAAEQFLEGIL